MTNNNIRNNKIDYYESILEESYYNSSYQSEVLDSYLSKKVPQENELTTKVSISKRG